MSGAGTPGFVETEADVADDFDRPADFAEEEAGRPTAAADEPSTEGGPSSTGGKPCLVVGPSAAGKTMLLLAIGRACDQPFEGQPDLTFIPQPSIAELMRRAVEIFIRPRERLLATQRPEQRDFEISTFKPRRWWQRRPHRFFKSFTIADGPGGALFPPEARDREAYRHFVPALLQAGQQASSIIFCVDAARPRSDLWQAYLPWLLSKMVIARRIPRRRFLERGRTFLWDKLPDELRTARWLRSFWYRFFEPRTEPIRRLTADRVLLLLTKIDQLAFETVEGYRDSGPSDEAAADASSLGGLSPAELAAMIDPLQQVLHTVDIAILNMIRSALKPGAQFAIGITSAAGFDPESGECFLDPHGKPIRLSPSTKDDLLRRWRPYGIYDAMYFILTGEARGTVRVVDRKHMVQDYRAHGIGIARSDHKKAR
ncbi:MAG: hypothetical protein GY856_39925 [bacterium]|nr:hypothetical protein [bacterium]